MLISLRNTDLSFSKCSIYNKSIALLQTRSGNYASVYSFSLKSMQLPGDFNLNHANLRTVNTTSRIALCSYMYSHIRMVSFFKRCRWRLYQSPFSSPRIDSLPVDVLIIPWCSG